MHFRRPQGGCKGFIIKGRPTSPARTVSQPIGKPFYGQAKGLLWLTWRSYAGPPQSIYLQPSTRPGGVSRSRTEPWQPRAKGPAAGSTLTPVRACQPSGIQESAAPPTGIYRHLNHLRFLPRSFAGAQDDVGGRDSPIPIPTAPQAPEPSSPKGACPSLTPARAS